MHFDAPVRRTVGFAAITDRKSYGSQFEPSEMSRRSCDARWVDVFENVWGALWALAGFVARPERVRATSPLPIQKLGPAHVLTLPLPHPLSLPKDMASRSAFSRLAPAITRARSARSVGARLARGYASQSGHTVRLLHDRMLIHLIHVCYNR